MFKNYLKVAFRSLIRNKLYSLINIFGLAVGMTACILIFLWVQDEISYDDFNEKSDNIYRIERNFNYKEWVGQVPITATPYGETLMNDYPEVTSFVRLDYHDFAVKDHRGEFKQERIFFADPNFFDIFTLPIIQGNAKSAFEEPYSIVITQDAALRYLGTKDALGQVIPMEFDGEMIDFTVSGIIEKVPYNSHFHFDILGSFATLQSRWGQYYDASRWIGNNLYTYILLQDDADVEALQAKLPEFIDKYLAVEYIGFLGEDTNIHKAFQLVLMPLAHIHLYASDILPIEPGGNIASVYIFSAVAFLILLIACVNFMNLSTARATKRAREVGMRKIVGADKKQLIMQFLGESVFYSILAFVIALLLVELTLPPFNQFTGKALGVNLMGHPFNGFILVMIVICTGLLAGLYPAFILSEFKPIAILKSVHYNGKSQSIFRRVLVVGQFAISIALIICTVTVYHQIDYIQKKSLGFDREQMVVLELDNDEVRQHYDAFRNTLMSNTNIKSVCNSSYLLGSNRFSDTIFKSTGSDNNISIFYNAVDPAFLETYGIELLAGRNFDTQDLEKPIHNGIINRRSAMEFGWENPEDAIGQEIQGNFLGEWTPITIIGVMDDFNFLSLHREIMNFGIFIRPDWMSYITVKIEKEGTQETLAFIEHEWNKAFPGSQFIYSFLDENLKMQYQNEQKMQDILIAFAILTIFVACLGLLGLASFTAEQRTKEIGIRKVLGASVTGIVYLLSKEFTRWVILANIIAWPASYFAMNKWLENFAYKTDTQVWIYCAAGATALFIAVGMVSFQAIKAAVSNPIKALKYE